MKTAYAVAILLATLSAHAYANDQKGGSGHSANAGLTGGATGGAAAASAHSTANAVTGPVRATGGNGGAGGAGGRGGNAKGGSSNVSVNNSAGGGGANGGIGITVPGGYGNAPCGGGIGLGGLALSGGGSGGGTLWEFGDCKRMRESSALLQLGYPDAALAELCQIDRVREAFGGTCPTPAKPHLALDTDADKYDYCFTRDAGDVNQHHECDRIRREMP